MQKHLPRALHLSSLLVCSALVASAPAFAQVDQGAITGIVQDTTGAVVPNANITLTDTNTGLVLHGTSNSAGVFNFTPIKIGDYTVEVSAQGFQAHTQQNIRVDIGSRINLPISLQTGSVDQSVTVSSAPPLLQTQDSSTGQVISTQAINNTPLNGRNWVYIAQLSAGVAPAFATSRGGGTGDFISNGLSAEQNNFVLDGVDNNTNLIDFLNGQSYVIRPTPDALAEFKIETGDYSAEFGHSAGAVINASVKSGTNEIHGDAWEYFRNTSLDARNWNSAGNQPYHQNQFGATLGFPIIKNKLFYFGDIEANRISIDQPSTNNTVPTALMRQGDFSELLNPALTGRSGPITLYQPNSGGSGDATGASQLNRLSCNGRPNVFCASQIDPVAQRILNLYPAPNANGGKTFNNYNINLNTQANTVQWDQRLDWNISPKDQAFARFSYLNAPVANQSVLGPVLDGSGFNGSHDSSHAENFAGSETHIFSPSLINEFRFGYNWGIFSFLQANAGTDVSSQLGLGGVPFGPGFPNNGGLPNVTFNSQMNAFGSATFNPSVESQNVYQILDNVTKNVGNHSMRFGVNFQAIRYSSNQPQSSRGQYGFTGTYTENAANPTNTGYSTADFLANQFNSANITNFNTVNDARWYRGAYFQDDWRALPSLTLNLGVRYDYYQSAKENAGLQANFVPGALGVGTGTGVYQIPARTAGMTLPPAFLQLLAANNVQVQYVGDERLVKPQSLNFAPRIGFAEQVNAKTVVRGGYGLFFGGLQSQGGSNLGLNPPFQVLSSLPTPNCNFGNCPSIGLTLENGFSQQLSQGLANFISTPGFHFIDANVKTPYTQDYNLSVERAITSNVVATVAYVGNVSRHLSTYNNWNYSRVLLNSSQSTQALQPFPGLGGIGGVNFAGIGNYNSFQAKLEQRTSHGLGYLATYTYAHSFSNVSDAGGLQSGVGYRAEGIIPIADEYTNSPNDTRHRFTINGNYQLPFGVGRAYLNRKGFLNEVAGGWSTSLTFTAQTGNPFTVTPNISIAAGGSGHANLIRDPFKGGGTPDPSLNFGGQACPATVQNRTNWYNPCAFANPLPGNTITGQISNPGQAVQYLGGKSEQIYGPGYERINMSFFKNFTTFREQYLQFRADAFNLFNHPSWGQPSTTTDDPNAGQITGPASFQNYTPDARFFQLALKYEF